MPLSRSRCKEHSHPVRSDESCCRHAWEELGTELTKAERAVRLAQDGFAFSFVEGALTRAVRQGHWLLLDEINLGPPEVALPPSHCAICWLDAMTALLEQQSATCTEVVGQVVPANLASVPELDSLKGGSHLVCSCDSTTDAYVHEPLHAVRSVSLAQHGLIACSAVDVMVVVHYVSTPDVLQALERIAGLLEGSAGSITLNERGDAAAIQRHPDFRLMAAMNPATDVGDCSPWAAPHILG